TLQPNHQCQISHRFGPYDTVRLSWECTPSLMFRCAFSVAPLPPSALSPPNAQPTHLHYLPQSTCSYILLRTTLARNSPSVTSTPASTNAFACCSTSRSSPRTCFIHGMFVSAK